MKSPCGAVVFPKKNTAPATAKAVSYSPRFRISYPAILSKNLKVHESQGSLMYFSRDRGTIRPSFPLSSNIAGKFPL
jgi:hypothetical protein